MSEPTVTLDNRDALIAHIEGLQAVIRKRNARITELESEDWHDARHDREVRQAYKRGWKDCADRLSDTTLQAAHQLRAVRDDAFQAYLEGDRLP